DLVRGLDKVEDMEDPDRTVIWRREPERNGASRGTPVPPPGAAGQDVPDRSVVNVNQRAVPPHAPAPPTATQLAVWRAQRVIYYLFGVVEATAALRFILKVVGANPSSPFTQLVYGLSWVFVFPFNGVLPTLRAGSSTIELFTLVAIAIYGLVSFGLVKLLDLIA
ncbi:MAG: hypothetical protein ACYDAG_08680, partial [Chloroflexota bacterium]